MNKDPAFITNIFDSISNKYDTLNLILSGGLYILWKYKFIKIIQPIQGQNILDVATGTGDIALQMAKHDPKHIFAVDISKKMINKCIKKIKKYNKNDRISCIMADATNLPFSNQSFDIITIVFGIRNIEDPMIAIKEFYRLLKPNGKLYIVEFFKNNVIQKNLIIKFYIKNILPIFGNLISNNNKAYSYLTESIYDFFTPEEFAFVLSAEKFQVKQIIPLHFKLAHVIECTK